MRISILLGAACACLSTQAAIWNISIGPGGLNGANEVPPNGSPARGGELADQFTGVWYDAPMTYDDESNRLDVNIAWGPDNAFGAGTGLSGTFQGAHIRGPADPGENANILFDLTSGYNPQDNGSGVITFSDTVFNDPANDTSWVQPSIVISDLQEADLLAGLWYISVASAEFPGGEIRGQLTLTPIPEPRHYALMAGFGLLSFAAYRRFKAVPAA